jgi:hypothetical protein
VGFFFYAGHGLQSGGTNFLIPADARIIGAPWPCRTALESLPHRGERDALALQNGPRILLGPFC